jgi:hypothetical protein
MHIYLKHIALDPPRSAMSALDSKAAFAERMKQLGVEDELKGELQGKGFETFGSLAFAVSTTPQQITDAVLDTWLSKVTNRDLSPYQTSCIRRLVVESHALALNDSQRKVDPPVGHQKTPDGRTSNQAVGSGSQAGGNHVFA